MNRSEGLLKGCWSHTAHFDKFDHYLLSHFESKLLFFKTQKLLLFLKRPFWQDLPLKKKPLPKKKAQKAGVKTGKTLLRPLLFTFFVVWWS